MKKLSKLYEELLNEGGSDILYHFTYISKLLNILNTNKLFLTGGISSKAEEMRGKSYFMSFSRTKSTEHGYGTKFQGENSVRMKIDGRKIGNNFKIIPIDYWQYPKTLEYMNNKYGDEMEDRVISDKDEISNANKYIISIDIFFDKTEGVQRELINKAKNLGIQINFFENYKDFASGDSNRAVVPPISNENKISDKGVGYLDKIMGALVYKNDELKNEIFNTFKSEFKMSNDQIDFYNKEVEKYHERLKQYLHDDDYYLTDLSNALDADLHNIKSSPNSVTRYINKLFIKDAKKNNVKSAKEYLLYKYYIGIKRQKDFNIEFNENINKSIKKAFSDNYSNYDYEVYDTDGNYVGGYLSHPPVKDFLSKTLNKLQKLTSNFILNDSEKYKSYWKICSTDLKYDLNLNDNEINNILSNLTNVDAEDVKSFIYSILIEVEHSVYSEIERFKNESK